MDNYKKVQELLKNLDLDAVLVSNEAIYVSGFAGETGYLYISQNRHAVITDFRYTIQAEMEAEGYEIITIGNGGYVEAINDMLISENIENIGFEAEDMLYSTFQTFKENLKVKNFQPIGNEITRMRRIKTANELEFIRKAEAIGDQVFMEMLDYIKPGMTELEIAIE